jgi:hypothetical protein
MWFTTLYLTVPATAPPGPVNVNVPASVILSGIIASSKVARIFLLVATSVASSAGTVDVTVGAVWSLVLGRKFSLPPPHPARKPARNNTIKHPFKIFFIVLPPFLILFLS